MKWFGAGCRISVSARCCNLEILSESGEVQKIELAGSRMRFDGNANSHYHVRCLRCGRVGDIEAEQVSGLEDAFCGMTDYEIVGHRLEFTGLCPECKAKVASYNKGLHKDVGKT